MLAPVGPEQISRHTVAAKLSAHRSVSAAKIVRSAAVGTALDFADGFTIRSEVVVSDCLTVQAGVKVTIRTRLAVCAGNRAVVRLWRRAWPAVHVIKPTEFGDVHLNALVTVDDGSVGTARTVLIGGTYWEPANWTGVRAPAGISERSQVKLAPGTSVRAQGLVLATPAAPTG